MKRIALLLVVVAAGLLAWPLYMEQKADKPYQGWVEADLLFVGAESTGRLASVPVEEGETLYRGTELFRLDDAATRAAVDGRRASLEAQQAQLRLAMAAQKRPEEITVLETSQRQAEAQLELSSQNLERIRSLADAGTSTRANLDSAIAAEAADRAGLDNINAQIALGRLPMRDDAVRQAEQQVAAARAELEAAQDSLDRMGVNAPEDGSVQTVYYRAGEIVPAGRPVVAILSPTAVRIRFFVDETRLATIAIGREISVTCDGCRPTTAKITFISATAEFTPPEIYSLEERAKLVYRVEAIPEDPQSLRPGQPVDVLPQGTGSEPR